MRKLHLDELDVTSFETTEAAWDREGTVHGFQTEPNSDFAGCTQTHCTYPVYLCRTAEHEHEHDAPAAKKPS